MILQPTSLSNKNNLLLYSFACYNVAFSPFYPNKLAVAGSANFGLVGNGRLSILGLDGPAPAQGAVVEKA